MEDHRFRNSPRLAPIRKDFSDRDRAGGQRRGPLSNAPTQPASGLIRRLAIKPVFENLLSQYHPDQLLDCSYRLETQADAKILTMETSVLWRSEGKGDEDLGVHFFDRRPFTAESPFRSDQRFKLQLRLPLSPLSYQGFLVKVGWLIRINLVLEQGQSLQIDTPFALVPRHNVLATHVWPKTEDNESRDAVD